ncbi:MAG: hypothetical protein K5694_02695 [Bacilli bacterium]|nr:hypothetical protein [Bacilli bacterium]
MKNALLIYSKNSGTGHLALHHDKILAKLRTLFDVVDERQTASAEEGTEAAKSACGVYHTLIVAGGDGTFHNAINALADMPNPPVLAYFNNGSVGDIGYNFGVTRNYKTAIKAIEKGTIEPFDIAKVNDKYYFGYVGAIGSYANIPISTKRKRKKALGRIAYYTDAVGTALKYTKVHVRVKANDKLYEQYVPFVLLINGRHVGGFPFNENSSIFDGKMELYLAKPGIFNGILQMLPGRREYVKKIVASSFDIHTDIPDTPWDFDGDRGPKGDIHVECLHNHLKVYSLRHPKKSKKQ